MQIKNNIVGIDTLTLSISKPIFTQAFCTRLYNNQYRQEISNGNQKTLQQHIHDSFDGIFDNADQNKLYRPIIKNELDHFRNGWTLINPTTSSFLPSTSLGKKYKYNINIAQFYACERKGVDILALENDQLITKPSDIRMHVMQGFEHSPMQLIVSTELSRFKHRYHCNDEIVDNYDDSVACIKELERILSHFVINLDLKNADLLRFDVALDMIDQPVESVLSRIEIPESFSNNVKSYGKTGRTIALHRTTNTKDHKKKISIYDKTAKSANDLKSINQIISKKKIIAENDECNLLAKRDHMKAKLATKQRTTRCEYRLESKAKISNTIGCTKLYQIFESERSFTDAIDATMSEMHRYFKVNDHAQVRMIDDAQISMKAFIDCSAVKTMQEIAGSVSDFFELAKNKTNCMQLKERGFRQARSHYISVERNDMQSLASIFAIETARDKSTALGAFCAKSKSIDAEIIEDKFISLTHAPIASDAFDADDLADDDLADDDLADDDLADVGMADAEIADAEIALRKMIAKIKKLSTHKLDQVIKFIDQCSNDADADDVDNVNTDACNVNSNACNVNSNACNVNTNADADADADADDVGNVNTDADALKNGKKNAEIGLLLYKDGNAHDATYLQSVKICNSNATSARCVDSVAQNDWPVVAQNNWDNVCWREWQAHNNKDNCELWTVKQKSLLKSVKQSIDVLSFKIDQLPYEAQALLNSEDYEQQDEATKHIARVKAMLFDHIKQTMPRELMIIDEHDVFALDRFNKAFQIYWMNRPLIVRELTELISSVDAIVDHAFRIAMCA